MQIVEVRERPLIPSYSWCESWTTGYDSIYSLLSKFALLNGLTAREMANLFVSPECGRKSILVQQLNIDLRDQAVFDVSKIASLCHTSEDVVRDGFVLARYVSSLVETCEDFRYCADCLQCGFHSPLFQLAFVPRCPIHGGLLKQPCEQCGGRIPYRLAAGLFRHPFGCPHCGCMFAPRLLQVPTGDLQWSTETHARLRDAAEIASAKSHLFGSAQQLERHFSLFGRGRLLISPPSMQRSKIEYYDFIDAAVRLMLSGTDSRFQESAGSERSDVQIVEIVRGNYHVRQRFQRWRLWAPSNAGRSQRPRSTSKFQVDGDQGRTTTEVRPPNSNPRRGRGPTARSELGGYGWDGKLKALYPIYQALRRHFWRRVIAHHRSCSRSAARRMWWDVEGDVIATFCPAAEAFLRWRMFWEGFGVPADLFKPPRHIPFGLLTWLCDGAPVCAEGWTSQGEQWLTHRVFAVHCARNFFEWWALCQSKNSKRPHRWRHTDVAGNRCPYWVVSGNDTRLVPLRLLMNGSPAEAVGAATEACARAHRQWHQRQLLGVTR